MVCVIPPHFAAIREGFHRCVLRFHAACEYLSNMRRLTCPAIAMMVESAAPLSASDVIAQWRRSWNRNPGNPAFFVSDRHAVRRYWYASSDRRP
jgi:hypothetical protein